MKGINQMEDSSADLLLLVKFGFVLWVLLVNILIG